VTGDAAGSPGAQAAHGVLYGLLAGRSRVGRDIDRIAIPGHEVAYVASASISRLDEGRRPEPCCF
jgi:hypothetical protein